MKKIVFSSLLVIALVVTGALFALRELTYAQMPDLDTAAQKALNTSPMNHIDKVTPYTGGPLCYAFFGTDKLGRQMVVFATKDKVFGAEFLDKGLQEAQAQQKAIQASSLQKIAKTTPGIVDETSKPLPNKPSGKFVWEVFGTNTKGEKQYTYLDFYNGNVLGTYVITEQH